MMSANTESTSQSELLFIEHLLDERLGKLKDAGLLLRELQTTVNKFLAADYAAYTDFFEQLAQHYDF
jgi:hypothetical protein